MNVKNWTASKISLLLRKQDIIIKKARESIEVLFFVTDLYNI